MKIKYTNNGILKRNSVMLFIMKTFIFFFCTTVFSFAPGKVFSQNAKIKIDANKTVSVDEIFELIRNQTKYTFIYEDGLFNHVPKVNIKKGVIDADKLLQESLNSGNFEVSVSNDAILIRKKDIKISESITIKGKVIDNNGNSLPSVNVYIKETKMGVYTDLDGNYIIQVPSSKSTLIFSYIGYKTKEIVVGNLKQINLVLEVDSFDLQEVLLSTGYQDLSKERVTGSFEVITKKQLQYSTDPNVLKRLEGITTSFDFRNDLNPTNSSDPNAKQSPLANLTIRGKNTLNYNTENTSGQVLVVIDGIASPYSIDKLNPNDIESITVLKDAASASIWGSRAANGVIVVKTKRGLYNKKMTATFNSSVNITEKVDLFYNKTMGITDYIDAQMLQFNTNNTYLPQTNISQLYGQEPVSPVAEIMNAWKNEQTLTESEAMNQIDALRTNDVRRDYTKYFLRNAVTQSYAMAVDGGSKLTNYRLSLGYDKTLNNTQNSDADRIALTYNMSVKPIENLELQANISYNIQRTNDQAEENRITGVTDATFYPYTSLADSDGNPLTITKTYRPGLVDLLESEYGDKLLSLRYKPLEDINEGYSQVKARNINLNFGANYKLLKSLSLQLSYNYNTGRNDDNTLYRQNSFYMRNLINYFTTSPYSTDPMTFEDVPDFVRGVPLGGLYQTKVITTSNQTARGQINFNKTFKEKHDIAAIAGMDIAQSYSLTKSDQYYGYDEKTLKSSNNINYNSLIPILFAEDFNGYNGEYVPKIYQPFIDTTVRTLSWYSNVAYTYDRRYTVSGSLRKDLSSEFGRGTNKGGSPYFSVGTGWNISNEKFYNPNIFSSLRARTTFGYNGNVNPLVIARPIITYIDYGNNDIPYAETQTSGSVSNSLLRPEKTGIWNLGLDFTVKGEKVSGSIEYYNKKTKDLLANGALDPSTGYTNAIYNKGNLRGYGIDFRLNSQNLTAGKFDWTSNFLFSFNKVKVTKLYASTDNTAGSVVTNSSGSYNEGYDLSRLFGYKWAGLDPSTGDPRGYLNGEVVAISNDNEGNTAYQSIQNAPISEAHFFGSAVPVYYGSFRNTFNYGSFSVSANLLYKLGYFFRRPVNNVVSYSDLFSKNGVLQGEEYANRWQKSGDEQLTNVPSAVISTNNFNRDKFYYYSDINVLKGDHIRLQEINFSYSLNLNEKSLFKDIRIYANINNLGIIWKANHEGIDPEVYDYPIPTSYSIGLSANF